MKCLNCKANFNPDYGQCMACATDTPIAEQSCNEKEFARQSAAALGLDPAEEYDHQEEEAEREDAGEAPTTVQQIARLKTELELLANAVQSYRDTCLRWEAMAKLL
jgi:hypothetical protein